MKNLKFLAIAIMATSAFAAHAQSSAVVQDIEKIMQDVKADLSNSDITKQELINLDDALMAAAATAHKPSSSSVSNLKTVIQNAVKAGTITQAEKLQIEKALEAVLVSAGLTQSEISALESAIVAILKSSNFTQAEAMQLRTDFQTLISDLPKPPSQP